MFGTSALELKRIRYYVSLLYPQGVAGKRAVQGIVESIGLEPLKRQVERPSFKEAVP
jgi:hypothetical protein